MVPGAPACLLHGDRAADPSRTDPRSVVLRRSDGCGRRVADGVDSVLEDLFVLDVEQAHGLPAAVRQAPFVVDGRLFWEDMVYDHVGVALTVRLDGRHHTLPKVAFRDRRRDNAAELAGRARLAFGWSDVSKDPCGVTGEVDAVLRRAGWQGPLRRCPRCS